jgi:endo-beta-N-acetylglucosaminidase D
MEIGYVVNQPIPRPKYQLPSAFGQPQETVVDLVVKTNDQTYNYNNLPAQQDVADSVSNGESLIVSDSRDAISSEIINLKQKSLDIANSKDYQLAMVDKYDKVLLEIHPEMAEKQEQKQEMDTLKKQMDEMSKSIAALMEANKDLIARLT